jgi:AraC-like DNA-binding protein
MFAYREMAPPATLSPFVRCYWELRGTSDAVPSAKRVLPDGCADLLFDFADLARRDGQTDTVDRWVGTMTRPLYLQRCGVMDMFGIRFAPGGLFPLLGVPLSVFTDQHVATQQLWPKQLAAPRDALAAAPDMETRAQIISRTLLAAMPHVPAATMPALLHWLEQLRDLPEVNDLAARAGFSERTLQRRFLDWVGVTPKQHLRYLRFARSLELLEKRQLDGADIASELLYADQAHFIHEFRSFADTTPGDWLRSESSLFSG